MFKFLVGTVLGVLAVVIAAGLIVVPKVVAWAEKEVCDAVLLECDGCEFSMGGVGLAWDGLAIKDLHLAGGDKGGQWVDFKARRIILSPVFSTLLSDTPHLRGVTLDHPEVIFTDGEKKSQSHMNTELDAAKIVIDEIFFYGGIFTYVRDVKGTHAVLTIHNIDGDIDPNPERAVVNVSAQIGKAGSIQLVATTPYTKRPFEVDTDIKVTGQNLEDLSVFFKPNAGVELLGTLTKGHSRSKLRGTHLSSWLFAEYKDFKLHVDKMYDRNDLQKFFTNLGSSIAIAEKNKDKPAEDKIKAVELNREKGESVVGFILRGLKVAALGVSI
ncbi:MAG: hypothetical protein ACXVA9_14170 [Bdellovibrionales bacterium]